MRDVIELPPYGKLIMGYILTAMVAFLLGGGVTFALAESFVRRRLAKEKEFQRQIDETRQPMQVWDVTEFDQQE